MEIFLKRLINTAETLEDLAAIFEVLLFKGPFLEVLDERTICLAAEENQEVPISEIQVSIRPDLHLMPHVYLTDEVSGIQAALAIEYWRVVSGASTLSQLQTNNLKAWYLKGGKNDLMRVWIKVHPSFP